MKTRMIKIISIVLVLVLGLPAKIASADFIFDTPTEVLNVNSSSRDFNPCISADALSLFFISNRPGGVGSMDIWVTTRETIYVPWGTPVNLGPTINSPVGDGGVSISSDGLSLYFSSARSSGYGNGDLWVATRDTTHNEWGTPMNLGLTVNSSADQCYPSISADGLALYFSSNQGGGYGAYDLWVTRRETIHEPWGAAVNLGPTVNTSAYEVDPGISADGRTLFFASDRSGGYGSATDDIWVTRRETTDDDWSEPMNLGSAVNSSAWEDYPNVSADGSTLFFRYSQSGRWSGEDIWQAPIIPIVDFNGDGIVDSADLDILIDNWGTDESLCDIAPTPLGDGIVDVHDLLVLTETKEKVDIEADITAINDVLFQYCFAMETGDLELWLSLHADDIVKMAPDAPATFGKEELRASTKPLFDNFTIEMDYNREEIQVDGDLGFARGTFTATMTPKAVGDPLYMDAKTLGIYKRQADGSWKLARNCYNSNVPPAPPAQ